MLDDGREVLFSLEFVQQLVDHGQVQDIVEGQGLAVQLVDGVERGTAVADGQERRLVGVLAVAQRLLPAAADGREVGMGFLAGRQVGGDQRVVEGGVGERLLGQLLPQLQGDVAAVLDGGDDRRVVLFIDQDDGVLEILGRGADQGRPADVDVLQHGIQVGGLFFQGGLEGIKIDDRPGRSSGP